MNHKRKGKSSAEITNTDHELIRVIRDVTRRIRNHLLIKGDRPPPVRADVLIATSILQTTIALRRMVEKVVIIIQRPKLVVGRGRRLGAYLQAPIAPLKDSMQSERSEM